MDAFSFITSANAKDILSSLKHAQCSPCGGTGKQNDAEPGDMFHRTWACTACGGTGWNNEAVRAITDSSTPLPAPCNLQGQKP